MSHALYHLTNKLGQVTVIDVDELYEKLEKIFGEEKKRDIVNLIADTSTIQSLEKSNLFKYRKENIILQTLVRIFGEYHPHAGAEKKDDYEKESGNYPYIPYDPIDFVKIIKKFKGRTTKFIDLGCGMGDKLILARKFCGFAEVNGIEYNTHTFELAKHFTQIATRMFEVRYPWNENFYNLIQGNFFDLDLSNYNFIYMYVPISNGALMLKLADKILKEMPVRARAIDVGSGCLFEALSKIPEFRITNKEKNPYKLKVCIEKTSSTTFKVY